MREIRFFLLRLWGKYDIICIRVIHYALEDISMPIPAEILAVERPKSTRVLYSFGRYLVVKRTSKRVNGRTVPVDLGTIGEIKDGKYIEIRKEPRRTKAGRAVDVKDYGEVALCNLVGKEIIEELKEVYDLPDATRIYVIALLRAAYHDIKNRDIQLAYDTSFASEMYPKVALSENTISTFLETVGMEYSKISQFMRNRIEKFGGSNLVVDGMLKDCNSDTDIFSEFSRKGSKKGSKDLTLMYAYDPTTREPVAVKPYPGNMLDLTSVDDFLTEFHVKSGLLVMDKGFYGPNALKTIQGIEGLGYIIPLKQSSKLITDNEMDKEITSILSEYKDAQILWKKKKIADNRFLYAFRNPKDAYDQEIGYLVRNRNKGTYSEDKYLDKQSEFGLIVFESNMDLDPIEVYDAYAKRWEIEIMFNLYKNIVELNTTRVHGDYRVYATEFINFLSVLISSKVKWLLSNTGIATKYSYKQVFHYLGKSKMARCGTERSWTPTKTVKYISDLMKILGV
jgi:hypothetical protein